jgi:hypothetical protein
MIIWVRCVAGLTIFSSYCSKLFLVWYGRICENLWFKCLLMIISHELTNLSTMIWSFDCTHAIRAAATSHLQHLEDEPPAAATHTQAPAAQPQTIWELCLMIASLLHWLIDWLLVHYVHRICIFYKVLMEILWYNQSSRTESVQQMHCKKLQSSSPAAWVMLLLATSSDPGRDSGDRGVLPPKSQHPIV